MRPSLRRTLACAAVVTAGTAFMACGSDDSSDSKASGSSGSEAKKSFKVAYLTTLAASPFVQVELKQMKQIAGENGGSVTLLDANLSAEKQSSQLQDIIATKKYDGVLVGPINAPALVPLVQQGIKKGIKMGAVDSPLGTNLTTADIQVDGLSGSVLSPTAHSGRNTGLMAIDACKGIDPCNVVWLHALKASAFNGAQFDAFKDAVKDTPNVKLLAEAESGYTRDGGLKAYQNVLQAHRDEVNVIISQDAAALGGLPALKSRGLTDKVKVIGIGGTIQAVEAIRAGTMYGSSATAPVEQGQFAMRMMVDAIRSGKVTPGIDPVVKGGIPDEGRITKANAADFDGQYAS